MLPVHHISPAASGCSFNAYTSTGLDYCHSWLLCCKWKQLSHKLIKFHTVTNFKILFFSLDRNVVASKTATTVLRSLKWHITVWEYRFKLLYNVPQKIFLWPHYVELIFWYFFEIGFSNYKIRKTHFLLYIFFSFACNGRKEGLFSQFFFRLDLWRWCGHYAAVPDDTSLPVD